MSPDNTIHYSAGLYEVVVTTQRIELLPANHQLNIEIDFYRVVAKSPFFCRLYIRYKRHEVTPVKIISHEMNLDA